MLRCCVGSVVPRKRWKSQLYELTPWNRTKDTNVSIVHSPAVGMKIPSAGRREERPPVTAELAVYTVHYLIPAKTVCAVDESQQRKVSTYEVQVESKNLQVIRRQGGVDTAKSTCGPHPPAVCICRRQADVAFTRAETTTRSVEI